MRKTLTALAGMALLGGAAFSDTTTYIDPPQDDVRVLDEVQIEDRPFNLERGSPTGRLIMDVRPVQADNSSLLTHTSIQLILRPVRRVEGNVYELNEDYGRRFKPIDVPLDIGQSTFGSRIIRNRDGAIIADLPEGLYAIAEVRYEGFSRIGRVETAIRTHRFCLSDRTMAFDVRNGETTNLGLILIQGLSKRFREGRTEHRPILAANAPIVPVSDPNFREKGAENQAHATEIQFDPVSSKLCSSTGSPVKGWYEPEEFQEKFPKIQISSTEE